MRSADSAITRSTVLVEDLLSILVPVFIDKEIDALEQQRYNSTPHIDEEDKEND